MIKELTILLKQFKENFVVTSRCSKKGVYGDCLFACHHLYKRIIEDESILQKDPNIKDHLFYIHENEEDHYALLYFVQSSQTEDKKEVKLILEASRTHNPKVGGVHSQNKTVEYIQKGSKVYSIEDAAFHQNVELKESKLSKGKGEITFSIKGAKSLQFRLNDKKLEVEKITGEETHKIESIRELFFPEKDESIDFEKIIKVVLDATGFTQIEEIFFIAKEFIELAKYEIEVVSVPKNWETIPDNQKLQELYQFWTNNPLLYKDFNKSINKKLENLPSLTDLHTETELDIVQEYLIIARKRRIHGGRIRDEESINKFRWDAEKSLDTLINEFETKILDLFD